MFKDLLDKGKKFVTDNAQKIKEKKEIHDEEVKRFNEVIDKKNKLTMNEQICINNTHVQEFNIQKILKMASSSINQDRAKTLAQLIPIEETIINVKYLKEETTGKYYYFILTNQRIYITDLAYYKKMEYNEITKCEVVVRNVLSKGLNINEIPFTIEGAFDEGDEFTKTLFNAEFRLKVLQENTSYLNGVVPSLQLINKYNAGITIDTNQNIVLHNGSSSNIIKLEDVEYIKLLLDSTVVYLRGINTTPLTTTKPTCYEMSLNFVTKNGEYNVQILPRNSLNQAVNAQDTNYIENFEFGKKIINTVINMKMGV